MRALSDLSRSGFVLFFALLLAGCSPITPPFMQNAMTVPIEVTIAYTTASTTHDIWRPQMTVACGREGAEITDLRIKASGHIIHHLSAQDIKRMLRSVPDPRAVVWEIRRTQIVPVSER
jgi:hypothetical protein